MNHYYNDPIYNNSEIANEFRRIDDLEQQYDKPVDDITQHDIDTYLSPELIHQFDDFNDTKRIILYEVRHRFNKFINHILFSGTNLILYVGNKRHELTIYNTTALDALYAVQSFLLTTVPFSQKSLVQDINLPHKYLSKIKPSHKTKENKMTQEIKTKNQLKIFSERFDYDFKKNGITVEQANKYFPLATQYYTKNKMLLQKLNKDQLIEFFYTAAYYGLNPFKNEIYAIPFKSKHGVIQVNFIIGYTVYLSRAIKAGAIDGMDVCIEGKEGNRVAIADAMIKGSHFIYRVREIDMKTPNSKAPICDMMIKNAASKCIRMYAGNFSDTPFYTKEEIDTSNHITNKQNKPSYNEVFGNKEQDVEVVQQEVHEMSTELEAQILKQNDQFTEQQLSKQ